MESKYQYFSEYELQCHGDGCCGHDSKMNHDFMVVLMQIRRELGFPLSLSSAYRCPIHNARESHTGETGPHTTGRAVDVCVHGTEAYRFLACALRYGMTGIGVKQKGSYRFIHIDNLGGPNRPWVWSY